MNDNKEIMLDFTEGSIPAHLIRFSIPLFLGNLLQTLYNTVDTIWVGRFLGRDALAAVSVSFPIIFIMVALVMGIGVATTVLVAQYKGADDEVMVKRTINNSLFILIIISIVLTTLGIIFNKSILLLMNTPDEILDLASDYLIIIFSGSIFTFGYNILSAILNGLGDSKTPVRFLFYTTVINIILDPIFIFGIGPIPKMGVKGAAIATVIAQGASFFLAVRFLNSMDHLLTIKLKELKYDHELTKKIIKIGLPAGIQQTVVALGMTIVMSLVNAFGATTVAAYGAAAKIDSFSFMPSMSIGLATSSLTGQNIGAGKHERVKSIMKWASILSITISSIITFIIMIFSKQLLSLFTNEQVILLEGAKILKILALSYIPFGMMWVFNGIIRGAGDTIITMFISIFSLWIVRVPVAYYLSKYTALGSTGIWIAISISSVLSMTLSMVYYYTGRWKKFSVVNEAKEVN